MISGLSTTSLESIAVRPGSGTSLIAAGGNSVHSFKYNDGETSVLRSGLMMFAKKG